MFKSWLQRLLHNGNVSPAGSRRAKRRAEPVRLHVEQLERRLTPAAVNLTATISGTTLTVTETSSAGINGITVTNAATFGELTVGVPAGNTINNQGVTFTTPKPITNLTVRLGAGPDTLTIGDPTFATTLSLTGGLSLSGTGGNKTLNFDSVGLLHSANLAIALSGSGTPTTTFTNVNVGGAATINQAVVGATVNILSSTNQAYTWGSLTIATGISTNSSHASGTANYAIGDTNFVGNVTISNRCLDGVTRIRAANDQNLANIGGNLSISSLADSLSELADYNVHGNVAIVGGAANTTSVGLEDVQSFATSGIPIIKGNVGITGGNMTVDVGESGGAGNLPLNVLGNFTITKSGPGHADITLNDLNVPRGTTTLSLFGSTTQGDQVAVQAGAGFTSVYNNFTLVSNGTGANTISLQDQSGTLVFGGTVTIQINAGTNSTVEVGADMTSDTGVAGALVELFGPTSIHAVRRGNTFFGAPGKVVNSNILFFTKPTISSNFTFS